MPVIVHCDKVVLPGPDGLSVSPANVAIEGDAIASVVPGPAVEGATTLRGKLIAPAFVNAHTHLAMSAFRGMGLDALAGNVVEDLYFRIETAFQDGDIRAFVRMAALECLASGTAVVWDHYYAGLEVADGLADVGLAGVVAPTLQDLDGPGVSALEDQYAATLELDARSDLAEAGVVAGFGPHATDTVSGPLWNRIADDAARLGLPVHAHTAQSVEEFNRAVERHGCTPMEWLVRIGVVQRVPKLLAVHGLFARHADIAALDRDTVVLGYCPASQAQYCFPAAVGTWRAAGIDVALGTDCGACNDGMAVQQEMKLVSGGALFGVATDPGYQRFAAGGAVEEVVRARKSRQALAVLDPDALLSMVWDVPGSLHPKLQSGRIEQGRRADLVVYDLEHPAMWPGTHPLRALALQNVGPAIWRMMVGGRWLTEGGRHHALSRSAEVRAFATEARERLERLVERLA